MAEVVPFKGLVYNQAKVGELGPLVAPPYDVISGNDRHHYYERHPYNILHIDLGSPRPEDGHPYSGWHRRSADLLKQWRAEEILIESPAPAFYYMETEYTNPASGRRQMRQGLVARMRLEEFGPGSKVKPHEKTFSDHKIERFSLMEQTRANLSQVFGFFPDPDQAALENMRRAKQGPPDMDFSDATGRRHRVWAATNSELVGQLTAILAPRTVYIADGHHRYDTALNYRDKLRNEGLINGPDHPANFLMVYLSPMSDPGLTILPTHRMLVPGMLYKTGVEFRRALEDYFDLTVLKTAGEQNKQKFLELLDRKGLAKSQGGPVSLGLYTKYEDACYLLTLKEPAAAECEFLREYHPVMRGLDTVVLTAIVFQEVLKMNEADMDNPALISYTPDLGAAFKAVETQAQGLSAILNPTSLDEVVAVAEAGLVMPRKSTYFYPKVTTGLVLNSLEP